MQWRWSPARAWPQPIDADQLADLAARVNTGELRVEVAQRVPLAELPALHADAAAGALPSGKVVIVVADA
ncbi:hypothetical protein [Micromonospora sp. NPDC002575]|uniref:hypothetical protein n=1 Tax=Micromonospora sp. NPDC002575 TaxID=3364222 RepID=UPI00368FD5B9